MRKKENKLNKAQLIAKIRKRKSEQTMKKRDKHDTKRQIKGERKKTNKN